MTWVRDKRFNLITDTERLFEKVCTLTLSGSRVGTDSAQGGRNAVEHIIAGGSLTHRWFPAESIVTTFDRAQLRGVISRVASTLALRYQRPSKATQTKTKRVSINHNASFQRRPRGEPKPNQRRTEVLVLTCRLTLCRPAQASSPTDCQ